MVLKNYIELEEGVPARMHFTTHAIVEKDITDPLTGLPKTVRSLILTVDRLGGEEVSSTFSVIQEKLAVQLAPHLEGGRYRALEFTITAYGKGFLRRFEVVVSPFI